MPLTSSSVTKYIGIFLCMLLLVFGIMRLRTLPPKTIEPYRVLQKTERIEGGSREYKKYTIQVPKGWAIARSRTKEKNDTLSIIKNNYKLEIYQKDTAENLNCNVIFAAESSNVLGASSQESFVEFKGQNDLAFRRSIIPPNPNAQKASNSVCQQKNSEFMLPTQFGVIEYETPVDANKKILEEMDMMVQSMK